MDLTQSGFSFTTVANLNKEFSSKLEITYNGQSVIKYHDLPVEQVGAAEHEIYVKQCQTADRQFDPSNTLLVVLLRTTFEQNGKTGHSYICGAYLLDDNDPDKCKVCSATTTEDEPVYPKLQFELHLYDTKDPLQPIEIDYKSLKQNDPELYYLVEKVEDLNRSYQPVMMAFINYVESVAVNDEPELRDLPIGSNAVFEDYRKQLFNLLLGEEPQEDYFSTDFLFQDIFPGLQPFATGEGQINKETEFVRYSEAEREQLLDSKDQNIQIHGDDIVFRFPAGDLVYHNGVDGATIIFRNQDITNSPFPVRYQLEAVARVVDRLRDQGQAIPDIEATYTAYKKKGTTLSSQLSLKNLYLLQQTLDVYSNKTAGVVVPVKLAAVKSILARFGILKTADKQSAKSLETLAEEAGIPPYPTDLLDAYLDIEPSLKYLVA